MQKRRQNQRSEYSACISQKAIYANPSGDVSWVVHGLSCHRIRVSD